MHDIPSLLHHNAAKAATKNSLTTKGTKNTEHKGHKEKLTKKRSFYRVIL